MVGGPIGEAAQPGPVDLEPTAVAIDHGGERGQRRGRVGGFDIGDETGTGGGQQAFEHRDGGVAVAVLDSGHRRGRDVGPGAKRASRQPRPFSSVAKDPRSGAAHKLIA